MHASQSKCTPDPSLGLLLAPFSLSSTTVSAFGRYALLLLRRNRTFYLCVVDLLRTLPVSRMLGTIDRLPCQLSPAWSVRTTSDKCPCCICQRKSHDPLHYLANAAPVSVCQLTLEWSLSMQLSVCCRFLRSLAGEAYWNGQMREVREFWSQRDASNVWTSNHSLIYSLTDLSPRQLSVSVKTLSGHVYQLQGAEPRDHFQAMMSICRHCTRSSPSSSVLLVPIAGSRRHGVTASRLSEVAPHFGPSSTHRPVDSTHVSKKNRREPNRFDHENRQRSAMLTIPVYRRARSTSPSSPLNPTRRKHQIIPAYSLESINCT